MHVDVIESLRCPQPHADGWLVATVDTVVDRRIMRGTLACPVCTRTWDIRDGALRMDGAGPPTDATGTSGETPRTTAPLDVADLRGDAVRTAALLDLRDARGLVLLTGAAACAADALVACTGVLVLAVNPPEGVARAHTRLYVHDVLPLGVETLRGARLDPAHASSTWLGRVLRAVERGGRVIAPVAAEVPPALVELARDEHDWVAEVSVPASGLVPLRRSGAFPATTPSR
jgi:uncharacterized protein YbaR (Trm112 family)